MAGGMDESSDGWSEGRMEGRMDGRMDGWLAGWLAGRYIRRSYLLRTLASLLVILVLPGPGGVTVQVPCMAV